MADMTHTEDFLRRMTRAGLPEDTRKKLFIKTLSTLAAEHDAQIAKMDEEMCRCIAVAFPAADFSHIKPARRNRASLGLVLRAVYPDDPR